MTFPISIILGRKVGRQLFSSKAPMDRFRFRLSEQVLQADTIEKKYLGCVTALGDSNGIVKGKQQLNMDERDRDTLATAVEERKKKVLGSEGIGVERQTMAFMEADMAVRLETSPLIIRRSAYELFHGRRNGPYASTVKVFTGGAANKRIWNSVQGGTSGLICSKSIYTSSNRSKMLFRGYSLPLPVAASLILYRSGHSVAGSSDGIVDDIRWYRSTIDQYRSTIDQYRSTVDHLQQKIESLLVENKDVSVKNMALTKDLAVVEKELLIATRKFYPRGIIERFEYTHLPRSDDGEGRKYKWGKLKDHEDFKKHFAELCVSNGIKISSHSVPNIAVTLYSVLSKGIHDHMPSTIRIDERYLSKEYSVFLQAVCLALPLRKEDIVVIPKDSESPEKDKM